jgi:MFS family permease
MTSTVVASPRLKVIQRGTLAMLVVSIAISTIDRAALAVANPLIRHDLGLSIAEMGMLLSAFLWAYAFSQLPIGALIDRFGPRWLLGCGLAVWSSAQLPQHARCSALARRRSFLLRHASSRTGSLCATAVRRPASSCAHRISAPASPRRYSRP